jgi:hypothetical protein
LPDHAGWSELLISPVIVMLSFSCSCLVSSSSSEVGHFSFECCPLVQEINSMIHYLPCFGGGLLLCLFTGVSILGVYFFDSPPFSGIGCIIPTPAVVSVLLQFTVWFLLLQGSSVLDSAL